MVPGFFHVAKPDKTMPGKRSRVTYSVLEAVPIGDGMQIGEKNFCLARKKLAGILTDFESF